MKKSVKEYLKGVIYLLASLLIIITSYNIIINIFHMKTINSNVLINNYYDEYYQYKSNVNDIVNLLNNNSKKSNNVLYRSLIVCLNSLKKDKMYNYSFNQTLNNLDLYEINEDFINNIIDNSWYSNLNVIDWDSIKLSEYKKEIDHTMSLLIFNSQYLKNELRYNDNYHYSLSSNYNDELDNHYKMILNNYNQYTKIILELSKYLDSGDFYG